MIWQPPKNQPVSDKEYIGRRLFGSDNTIKTTSAKGKEGAFKLEVFLEERDGEELSVDRLGIKHVEDEVASLLAGSDCRTQAKNLGKPFAGWAGFPASFVRQKPHQLDVKATPHDNNKYHADITTAQLGDREKNLAAFALASIASPIGAPVTGEVPTPERQRGLLGWLRNVFKALRAALK